MADLYILKTSIRDLLRAKRVVASLLLIAAPAGIALLWRMAAREMFDPYDAYNTLMSVVVYGFLLVILSVVFGTGVISQEVEQKTIVYLLTRPVPRWRIVLMKFLAAVLGILVTVVAATLLLGAVTVGSGGEKSSVLRMRDLRDRSFLVNQITAHDEPVSEYLYSKMPDWVKEELEERQKRIKEALEERRRQQSQQQLPAAAQQPVRRGGPGQIRRAFRGRRSDGEYYQRIVLNAVNQTLQNDTEFYHEDRFPTVYADTPAIQQLIKERPKPGPRLTRLNRLLVERYWSTDIAPRTEAVFPLRQDLMILPVGALAYGALFLLLATLLNRPLMYGLVFAFGWESWAPNLPGSFKMASIMAHLRTLSPHAQPAAETVDLLQFLSGGIQTTITEATARNVLIGVILVSLALALAIFSRFEYVPREDAE